MEVRVLGPTQVVDDSSSEMSVGGPQQRQLLAALVLRNGDVVSVDELAEWLWGRDQPDDAAGALRQGVTRLRRVIGSESIVTVAPGYHLQDGTPVDARRVERLEAEGRRLLGSGDAMDRRIWCSSQWAKKNSWVQPPGNDAESTAGPTPITTPTCRLSRIQGCSRRAGFSWPGAAAEYWAPTGVAVTCAERLIR
jgi:hypothetical protein